MTLLERIKELREQNGKISINKLEKEAGLTRGSMSKWDDHAPSYEKLKKVADYFGVPVEYLLTDEENADTIVSNVSQYEAILAWTVEQQDVPDRVKDVIQSELPPSSMGPLAALIDKGQKEKSPGDAEALSAEDIELVKWFRSLPEEKRQAILALAKD